MGGNPALDLTTTFTPDSWGNVTAITDPLTHVSVHVPGTASQVTGLASGNYSLTVANANTVGALKSVTINNNGSVTGHYEAETGSRIGANLTICTQHDC